MTIRIGIWLVVSRSWLVVEVDFAGFLTLPTSFLTNGDQRAIILITSQAVVIVAASSDSP